MVKLSIVLTPQFLSHDQGPLTKELQQHVKSVTCPCEYLRKTILHLPPPMDPLPPCLPVLLMLQWITQHPSQGPMPLKMDLPPGDPGVLPLSCPQECPDPHSYPGPRSPTPGLPSSAVNDDLLLLPSSLPSVTKGLPRCQLWNEGCPWEMMTLSDLERNPGSSGRKERPEAGTGSWLGRTRNQVINTLADHRHRGTDFGGSPWLRIIIAFLRSYKVVVTLWTVYLWLSFLKTTFQSENGHDGSTDVQQRAWRSNHRRQEGNKIGLKDIITLWRHVETKVRGKIHKMKVTTKINHHDKINGKRKTAKKQAMFQRAQELRRRAEDYYKCKITPSARKPLCNWVRMAAAEHRHSSRLPYWPYLTGETLKNRMGHQTPPLATQEAEAEEPPKPKRRRAAEVKPSSPKPKRRRAAEVKPSSPKPKRRRAAEVKPSSPKPKRRRAAEVKPSSPKPKRRRAAEVKTSSPKPKRRRAAEVKTSSPKPKRRRAAEVKPSSPKPKRRRDA
ncbi:nuclear pore complex-interacting protein family member B12 isoform X1 [Pan paniscus]|uniref:nuclear pore complex-interacting protein family member B12 isoform X1 n=1 Tax=Pan paniscus TaxID=9597 RepID=UPI00300600E8